MITFKLILPSVNYIMYYKFTFFGYNSCHTDHLKMVSLQCVLSDVTQDELFSKNYFHTDKMDFKFKFLCEILLTVITWKLLYKTVPFHDLLD